MGEKCSSGCPTRDHRTLGECLRSKGVKVAYANSAGGMDYTKQKKWDRELQSYADARRQGVQPSSTKTHAIENAMKISEATGQAFQA